MCCKLKHLVWMNCYSLTVSMCSVQMHNRFIYPFSPFIQKERHILKLWNDGSGNDVSKLQALPKPSYGQKTRNSEGPIIWNDKANLDTNGCILFLHSSYTHWVYNPQYCSDFNGIILPLATTECHSRVSERWEYRRISELTQSWNTFGLFGAFIIKWTHAEAVSIWSQIIPISSNCKC